MDGLLGPQPPGLLNIPPELVSIILSNLEIRELKPLMETCQALSWLTAPAFYEKIYTREGSPHDTAGLVGLLTRRPYIRSLVHYLVIDELDETAVRQLLAFDLPNLRSILVQHEKAISKPANAETKRRLNALITHKPRIYNYRRTYYRLSAEDAIFFHNPSLTRVRLSYLDLEGLKDPSVGPFPFGNLTELHVEACKLSRAALDRILAPATSLRKFHFMHQFGLPCAPDEFVSLLGPSRDTLRVLKLHWSRFRAPETACMRLVDFTAIKQLVVDPLLLLGSYTAESDVAALVRDGMPPNLKVLSLDNVQPWDRPPLRPGWGYALSPANKKLIRTLVEEKEYLLPRLRLLTYYYGDQCAEDLASYPYEAHGMGLTTSDADEDLNFSMDWLDSDEE
ncbi:hypothetical protein CSUB01_09056 [Colletotrichum sublineola]|uniref:F-box domain-containing protein n=1 Tax=Colletotrichum sublineola TaxID=1173701 RepID=A0A066XSZ7_COLSU|nr:hypothetical protein CSUB01_09056 [Colletotrichum sublineola]